MNRNPPNQWPRGTSGNPSGRPKTQLLTDALRKSLKQTAVDTDGKRRSGVRIVARVARELLLFGRSELPNGEVLHLSPADWLKHMVWVYEYLEPPVQRVAPTDPTGEHEYLGLGDTELITEATRILDAARARAAEQGAGDSEVSLESAREAVTDSAAG